MKKLLILICLLWNTTSHAELQNYDLFSRNMPMLCGTQETIDQYILDNNFTAVNISFGRQNGLTDGDIVFAVKYYINEKHQTLAVAEIPNDPLQCILYLTYNMKMNETLLGTGT